MEDQCQDEQSKQINKENAASACSRSGFGSCVKAEVDNVLSGLPFNPHLSHRDTSQVHYHGEEEEDNQSTLSDRKHHAILSKEISQKLETDGASSKYRDGEKSVSDEEGDVEDTQLPQEVKEKDSRDLVSWHQEGRDPGEDCLQTSQKNKDNISASVKPHLPQDERKYARYESDLKARDLKNDSQTEDKDGASSTENKDVGASPSARRNLPDKSSTTSNLMASFANPYLLPPHLGGVAPLPFPSLPHASGNPLLMLPPIARPFLMLPHHMNMTPPLPQWPFLPVPTRPQKISESEFVGFSALNLDDAVQEADDSKKVTKKQTRKHKKEDVPTPHTQVGTTCSYFVFKLFIYCFSCMLKYTNHLFCS